MERRNLYRNKIITDDMNFNSSGKDSFTKKQLKLESINFRLEAMSNNLKVEKICLNSSHLESKKNFR